MKTKKEQIRDEAIKEWYTDGGSLQTVTDFILNHPDIIVKEPVERKEIGRIVPYDIPTYMWKNGDIIPISIDDKNYYEFRSSFIAKEIALTWEIAYENDEVDEKIEKLLYGYCTQMNTKIEDTISDIKKLFNQ